MNPSTITILFARDKQEEVAKFVITDASMNGVDQTPQSLEAGAYLVFYTTGVDKELYMSNFWPKSDSQGYGAVYSMKSENLEETDKL